MTEPNSKYLLGMTVTLSALYYVVILMFAGSSTLRDPDTLWHIRTGQWILENRQFPVVDLFSYTAAGQRWISPEWLSEILLLFAYKLGGWHGTVFLSAVAIAAIVGIICFYLLRHVRFSVAVAWTALTALAVSSHFLARPHIFSYLLLLIWLVILLDAYDRQPFKPPLVTLIALVILWANLHPSFTFGLFLLSIFAGYVCFENILRRKYRECGGIIFMVVTVCFASLLNPYGLFSALVTLEISKYHFALSYISEWVSPNFQVNKIHLFLLVGFFSAIAGFGLRITGPRLIIFAAITYLGLSHTRGLTTFFFLAPLIFARPLSERVAWCRAAGVDEMRSLGPIIKPDPVLLFLREHAVTIPSIMLALAALVTGVCWLQTNVGPSDTIAPKDAIAFVKKAGISGNVFNSYNFGGYLIFSHIPTFIDGRTFPFTDDFIKRFSETVALIDINESFRMLDEYKVNWALLLPKEPLSKALAKSQSWDRVYADEYAVVFVRRR